MNNIDTLIAELCPDGVEWKILGEIAKISNGKDHKLLSDGNIPVYGSGGIMRYANEYIYDKESVLIPRKGSIGNIFYIDIPFWTVDTIFYTKINCDLVTPKFLYYHLKTLHLEDLNTAGGVPSLTKSVLDKISIPIPPLPIQQEIVNILDKFTQLQTELQTELQARRAQYEYYRNELLNFNGKEVIWSELHDCVFYPKSRISAATVNNENYVGVENLLKDKQGKTLSNYVPTTGALIGFQIDDILIGNIRPYLKKIWYATNNGGTNGDVVVFRIKPEHKMDLSPKFLFFLLSSDKFFDYDMQSAKGGKMPRGDKSTILKYRIPIPPLAEQNRIVAILDKFDKLVNDIYEGLPAEIEARRKQYEYYRGKLLDFKPFKND